MRFKPLYILADDKNFLDRLQEASENFPYHFECEVPKSARGGDVVLMLAGAKFIGEGVIRDAPITSPSPGVYLGTIGAIKLWEPGITVAEIEHMVSGWKRIPFNRAHQIIEGEFQEAIRSAINKGLDNMDEHEESSASRGSKVERPTTQEVISVPAGNSFHITELTGVHACPEEYPWSSYKEASFMTFRPTGGAMKTLYRVEWKDILPRLLADLEIVPEQYRQRVKHYIERRLAEWSFTGNNFKFYVLSTADNIDLPHGPKLARNIQGHCYFRLADLQSGQKIVKVASQSDGSAVPLDATPPPIISLTEAIEKFEVTRTATEAGSLNAGKSSNFDEQLDDSTANEAVVGQQISAPFELDLFAPESLSEAREYIARLVVARRGQAAFRNRLLAAYEHCCAFTGYSGDLALEAAHIVPYCGPDSDRVANGLLLRADIHTLFDAGLIVVDTSDPNEMTLVLAPDLKSNTYKYLNGKVFRLPTRVADQPSREALNWHRTQARL